MFCFVFLGEKLLWVNTGLDSTNTSQYPENSCMCTGLDLKGNDKADRLVSKATLTNGLLPGRSEVLRNLRHYPRAPHHRSSGGER